MKFKGLIFDLDGTLVDSLGDLSDSMNRVLTESGFPTHELKAYKHFVGNGIRNLVREALPESLRTDEKVTFYFQQMMDIYSNNCLVKTKPYDGIQELLSELTEHGFKLAVFSNKVDDLTKKIVATLFPEVKFDYVLGASPERPRKPNPEGAFLISKELGIEPGEFIFVGDSGVDMQTAKAAGMYALGVLWGYRAEDELMANGANFLAVEPKDIIRFIA